MALLDAEPGTGRIPAVRLDGRYEILPDSPVESLRSPAAAAFRVIDSERPGDALFALICDPGLPPRQARIDALSALCIDELMAPRDWGVVEWPLLGRRAMALIFAQPGGARLAHAPCADMAPLAEADVLGSIIPCITTALKALFALGITHRAIRPTNLYRRADGAKVVLGECVSAPPGSAQPVAYEPIESGVASPLGRGDGIPADDLYALGVTLIHLLLGHDPGRGRDDNALLREKMNRGSFVALLDGERPPLSMIDILRGLLADDPRERWTLDDLQSWVARRQLAARQLTPPRRAARPLELCGTGHITARSVAQAFACDPAAAEQSIRSGDFEAWLQHGLADPERIAAVAQAMADDAAGESPAQTARLVARIAMALDPRAPLRYAGFAAALDGFGPALAAAYRSGSGTVVIAEAIMARLPQFWCSLQPDFRPEQSAQWRLFDRLRHCLDDRRPGFGIERLLYELNPGLHCLFPAIERECVIAADEILPALERASVAGRISESPVDRHVAAFLAVRCRGAVSEWHDDLASADPLQRALGALQVLARLQSLYGPARVPSLSDRFGHDLPKLIERYRGRSRRTRLAAVLARMSGKGDLVQIAACVAGPGERRRDEAEFQAARDEFAAICGALAAVRGDLDLRSREAALLGGRMTVTAAVFLAGSAALVSYLVAG